MKAEGSKAAAIFLLAGVLSTTTFCKAQLTPKELLALPASDAKEASAKLVALGDAAVQPVLDALAIEKGASPIRIAVLIGILQSLNTLRSQEGLLLLLSDERPFVRGTAARSLGLMGATCAVPALTSLIGDSAEHTRETSTDPPWERVVTVDEAASDALRKLTGLSLDARNSPEMRRGEYQQWWRRNSRNLPCSQRER